jgi:phosphatidylinositol alpha-1,6-mannosyltransferase
MIEDMELARQSGATMHSSGTPQTGPNPARPGRVPSIETEDLRPAPGLRSVTLLSEDYPPNVGGVAQWARGVARGLRELGCEIDVICRDCQGYSPAGADDFPVDRLQHSHWKRLRTVYWRRALRRRLAAGDAPDVVIASKWNTSRGIVRQCRSRGIQLVTVVHGTDVTRPMPALKRRWLRSTLRASEVVLSVSQFTADYVVRELGIDEERVEVVPNGVDPEAFAHHADHAELESSLGLDGAPVVLTLSRVIERKGHDMVIRALGRVRERVPSVRYLVAGPGAPEELERLRSIARSSGVEDAVQFLGYVDSEDLARVYGLCDVYVMPSRYDLSTGDSEGFGITYLEANACGKPVIGGASGGIPDAIEDGRTGYLVDPLDPEEIADRLIELLEDPARAREMGARGLERVHDRYNWPAISRRILELLEERRT